MANESEEKYQKIVEDSPCAIAIADIEGSLTYVNPSFLEMWGFSSEEEVLGKPAVEFWQEEEQAAEILKALIKKGGFVRELVAKRKDGSSFNAELSTNFTLDDDGNPLCIMNSIVDITKRKQMEEALRASEEKFRQFFENDPDYCYMVSPEGLILDANRAALMILGYEKEEIVGKPLKMIYALESMHKMEKLFAEWAGTGQLRNEEMIIKTKKGDKRIVLLSAAAARDENGKIQHSISVQRDITEQKKAEKELKEAQEELIRKEGLAVLGQLAGSMAHEIRNPLGNIRSSAYYLNMKLDDAEGNIRRHLDIINKNVQQVNKIITDLLDFSRVRGPTLAESDVNQLMRELLASIDLPKNISIKTKFDKRIAKTLVDPDQIQQVFLNIITNAIQAMPEGGSLEIETRLEDKYICIKLEDSGEGIPEENVQKVFEPLYTTRARGIGLGLSIVKNIVENHEGTIEIESEFGKGTVITLRLLYREVD